MSTRKPDQFEVWLTLEDAGFGVFGRVVFDDELDELDAYVTDKLGVG
jgi:hypothetical protein